MGKRGPGAKPARAVAKPPQPAWKPAPEGATRAERVIGWIEGLTITSGAGAGQRLALRPWQKAIIRRIYATDGAGRRPVRTGVISMGRKGGKSTLCAALALCHLVGPEAVPRGQVVSAAADRGQATIIYNELRAFALAEPEIADRVVFRDFNKTVEDVVTGSTFAALSADHRKAHGLSPTVAICDEVAQWRGRELLDALRTGQGAHAEPLLLAISTRSPDPDNPLEELIRYAGQVADGTIADPTFASAIYSAPADADPWEEETWRLANPDADEVRIADIRVQAAQARRLPSLEASFRAYTLNMPVAPDERFIGPADWDACVGEAEARGPCFGGLDLASGAADLTAFALYWPETGALKVWAFLPSAKLDEKAREDHAPYREWHGRGLVEMIPGRAIDRPWLLTWIAERVDGLDLAGIACDRWGINDVKAVMEREGLMLPLKPHGAGYRDMSPALTAFEALVLDAKLRHGGNPLLRWAVANAAVDMDSAGNRKLSKERARGRIDPLVAAVTAVGLASREPPAATYDNVGWLAA
jgi:phage terminase large subunit-like protein